MEYDAIIKNEEALYILIWKKSPKHKLKKQGAEHYMQYVSPFELKSGIKQESIEPNKMENLLVKIILCMVYLFSR